jgi:hypothetical protein
MGRRRRSGSTQDDHMPGAFAAGLHVEEMQLPDRWNAGRKQCSQQPWRSTGQSTNTFMMK